MMHLNCLMPHLMNMPRKWLLSQKSQGRVVKYLIFPLVDPGHLDGL
jgi:hypothetical protein